MRILIELENAHFKQIDGRVYLDVTGAIEIEGAEQTIKVVDDTKVTPASEPAPEPKAKKVAKKEAKQTNEPVKVNSVSELAEGDKVHVKVLDKEPLEIKEEVPEFEGKILSINEGVAELQAVTEIGGETPVWELEDADLNTIVEIYKL